MYRLYFSCINASIETISNIGQNHIAPISGSLELSLIIISMKSVSMLFVDSVVV